MTQPRWKITFGLEKNALIRRADGVFLIGEASGPELDGYGSRMAPEAIELFASQVNAQADLYPVEFRDAHMEDGVLSELGSIVRAWVDENFHLGVEIKLDMKNPAAAYLADKLEAGKQYGLSIGGIVQRYADEYVAELQKVVRTYYEIWLEEISLTKRPAWTPSFGTVLRRSIDEAHSSDAVVEGESTSMDDELQRDEPEAPAADAQEAQESAPVADAPVESGCPCPADCEGCTDGEECQCPAAPAAAPVEEPAVEESVVEEPAPEADAAPEAEPEVVQNSAPHKIKRDAYEAMVAADVIAQVVVLLSGEVAEGETDDARLLRGALSALQAFLASEIEEIGTAEESAPAAVDAQLSQPVEDPAKVELAQMFEALLVKHGLITTAPEESVSQDDSETTVTKSQVTQPEEGSQQDEVAELRRSLAEATARIKELEEAPASTPPVLHRTEDDESFESLVRNSDLPTQDKLRLSFARLTGGR